MVTFRDRPTHLTLAPATSLYGGTCILKCTNANHHYSTIKEAMQREIAAISATILTNVMRNFSDRLEEHSNVEGRPLQE